MNKRPRVSLDVVKKFKALRALAQRLAEDVRTAKHRKVQTRDLAKEDVIFLKI